MPSFNFIDTWLETQALDGLPSNLVVLAERPGQRELIKDALRQTVLNHFVGSEIIDRIGGYRKAAHVVKNTLPVGKITRSGDFGEIIATEYVDQITEYTVPVRRLRYKDDRGVSMRGDDLLAFDFNLTPVRVLKTEAKSRVRLSLDVVNEASNGLCRCEGRPNSSSLSFISRRLRETGMDHVAEMVEHIQESDIPLASVSHLIFTFSGNDPAAHLLHHAASPISAISRKLVGCHVPDHSTLISEIFTLALGEGTVDGNS